MDKRTSRTLLILAAIFALVYMYTHGNGDDAWFLIVLGILWFM